MEPVIIVDEQINEPKTHSGSTNRIKVLWFTTSPSLSRQSLDGSYNIGTSWIEAMESLVHQAKNIELAIAFVWNGEKKVKRFSIKQSPTQYYAMPRRPVNKASNFIRRFLCLPEPESVIQDCIHVINDFKPDLINFFGTENPFPQVIPLVDIPHVIWFQGNLTVYQKKWYSGVTKWQSIWGESLVDLLLARSDFHAFMIHEKFVEREKKIFSYAQNIIGRTDWDRRLVSSMAPQAHYHHCEEVMRDPFHKNSWQPKTGRHKYVIVSTFRDNLYKGLETAMEAFSILKKISPKSVEWRIIGVPKGSHYDRICRKVSGLKDQEGFKVLGSRPADDIIHEILDADLFVHPSHIDNSPNSLCEAMMLGIPIVGTNVGGVPSMLKDGDEGILVQDGDPYAMAGAILGSLTSPDHAQEMAQNAQERAHKRHNQAEILNRLIQVYTQILKSTHKPCQ